MSDLDIRNFEAVALDFDGTLANSNGVHTESRLKAYAEMAINLDDPRYVNIPNEVHDDAFRHGAHAADINAWILAEAGIIDDPYDIENPAVKAIVDLKNYIYHERISGGLDEQPGATQFVRSLMPYRPGRLSIVSTAYPAEVMPFLNRYKLNRCFPDSKLILHDNEFIKELKPAPDAYEVAMGALAVSSPNKMLVIEDSPEGIESANRAGAVVVALATTRTKEYISNLEGYQKPASIFESFYAAAVAIGMTKSI